MNPERLLQEAEELKPELVRLRRDLHRHPELSMQEVETTRKIREALSGAGIRLLPLDLPVGVLAEVEGAEPGPTVALRADIDALPVTEETGLPFASEIPGKMHACGHDFHTAAIVGAALLLKRHAAELKGTVRLLFQPAEEKGTGAKAMIGAGALQGVQAIFGMHNKPELPVGTVGLASGPLMASVDGFKLTVTGKGGHAAIPDAAIDPIVAASAIVGGLQTAVSRSISPLDSAVVSVCSFHAGSTWNVIPDEAVLDGTVRTFRPEVRQKLPDLLQRIAGGIAAGYGAEARLTWFAGIPSVMNHPEAVEIARGAAQALNLQVTEALRSAGGEDFAHYQEQVPGCFLWMGTSGTEEWHHPKFTLNEDALTPGAALFALTAVHALDRLRG
ncbi:putative hydrolase YxeP [Paenibacillus tyrfis]|uniref:amidohydrolase n=1 Tax=Paenibacillus tyrfis TaxID=1501230 RepID=UPI00248FE1B0|nr:amidohydrolase [Paenibacillus tyrfis]GLI09065.1 putative hydrolase YxeP [Paenibacillus tyrfis]